jgi:hypothetical protein
MLELHPGRTFGTEGTFRIKKSRDTNSLWRSNATLIPKAKSSKFLGPAKSALFLRLKARLTQHNDAKLGYVEVAVYVRHLST